ncbi:MAG: glycerol-3-phosphate 1-O-acyltransferase PlsY [Gammaproteobacteria bacterium]
MLTSLILIALSYCAGSLSSAVVVCRMLGHGDPREGGSGNPGATNVLRQFGKRPAALTLAGDLLKGLLAVWVGRIMGVGPVALGAIGLAAFLGHLYPVFFEFRGGKGVATYIGVLIGYGMALGAGFGIVWLAMAALFRYSSLAALVAAALSPLLAIAIGQPAPIVAAMVAMVALLAWRHRDNIRSLAAGTERRIGSR